jgi:hypothetical protein
VSTADLFRRLLVPLWLRPERALWEAHQLFAVREFLLNEFEQPSLEYGCLDGVLTFVLLGGEFSLEFDDYLELTVERHSGSQPAPTHRDYFDQCTTELDIRSMVARRPDPKFSVGISWKESHINKARRLDVYDELRLIDLGSPLAGVPTSTYRTIFAPMLFWLENDRLGTMFDELRRIVHPDGRVITIFPGEPQAQHSIYPTLSSIEPEWAKSIDRGIHENLTRSIRPLQGWDDFFNQHQWIIGRRSEFITPVINQIYQIGLRPMFPVMVNMYHRLRRASLPEWRDLKSHWIETVEHFLAPLCSPDWREPVPGPRLWQVMELRPTAPGGSR